MNKAVAAVALAAVMAGSASAQLLNNSAPAVSTMSAAPSGDLQVGYTRDVVYGSGSSGPYTLSWNNIPASRETVVVDGHRLLRSMDYTIDYGKGNIRLSSPLKQTSMAIVEYPLDPRRSERNSAGVSVPMAFDLYDTGRSSLQLTALYQGSAAGASSGQTLLGLTGASQIFDTTKVTAQLYMAPGTDGASAMDAAAASIEAATALGNGLSFNMGYVSAGRSFTGAKDSGMKAGQEVQDLAMAWHPEGGRASFTSALRRVELASGSRTSSLDNVFNYTLSPSSKLMLARSQVDRTNGASSGQALTNTLKLTSSIGKSTSGSFLWVDATDSSRGGRTGASKQHLSVSSSVLTGVNVAANVIRIADLTSGQTNAMDVGVVAKPYKFVELNAQFSGSQSDASGSDTLGSVRIAAKPSNRLKVSTGFSDRLLATQGIRSQDLRMEAQPWDFLKLDTGYTFTDSGSSQMIARDIKAWAQAFSALEFDGLYKVRDYGANDLQTMGMTVTLKPWKYLGVVAAVAGNPEDNKGNVLYQDTRSLGLDASVGVLSLSGDYSYRDEYLAEREWFQTRLGVGLLVARATSITSDYEYSETSDTYGMSQRRISLGLRRDLGSDFNLAVSGSRLDTRDTAASSERTDYEANVNLGVRF